MNQVMYVAAVQGRRFPRRLLHPLQRPRLRVHLRRRPHLPGLRRHARPPAQAAVRSPPPPSTSIPGGASGNPPPAASVIPTPRCYTAPTMKRRLGGPHTRTSLPHANGKSSPSSARASPTTRSPTASASPSTPPCYHVSEILSKLHVSTREEAAAWAPEGRPGLAPSASLIYSRWSSAALAAAVAALALLSLGTLFYARFGNRIFLRQHYSRTQPNFIIFAESLLAPYAHESTYSTP